MTFSNVPAGKLLPYDLYAIIEIPAYSNPVKYEIDKKLDAIFVDRFISTPMFYPCNYGYINNTLSLDGDPVDILVPTPYPVVVGSILRCRPVGVLKTTDESGQDYKIIAMPHESISKKYNHIRDIVDIPKLLKAQIMYFFTHYKDMDSNKWVKVDGWLNISYAHTEILQSYQRTKETV